MAQLISAKIEVNDSIGLMTDDDTLADIVDDLME